ncbi:MAG: peroxiredoxin family protein [Alphaproteobacteria bacterium]
MNCRREFPAKEKLYRELKDKGVMILEVSYGESEELLRRFQKDFSVTFPILFDLEGKTAWDYQVRGHPVTYLIDRQGLLVGKVIGERDWSSPDAKYVVATLLSQ